MPRSRDYKLEYQKRLARAAARGLSRSQARGHPKPSEPGVRGKANGVAADDKLKQALRHFRKTRNQHAAAKAAGISPERFRRFVRENKIARRKGSSWLLTDRVPRDVQIISDGENKWISVRGFKPASLAMKHRAVVRAFLVTNDISKLAPFRGQTVTDIASRQHELETEPNVLYRLASTGAETFEQIYRLVTN